MKKIGVLLYRNHLLMRKNQYVSIAAVIIVALFGWLVMLSARCGNLARYGGEELQEMMSGIVGYFVYMVTYITICLATGEMSWKADCESNWSRYAMTLPVSACDRALTILLYKYIRLVFAFGFVVLDAYLMNRAVDQPIGANFFNNMLLIAAVSMLLYGTQDICVSFARDQKSFKTYLTTYNAIVLGLSLGGSLWLSKHIVITANNPDYEPDTAMFGIDMFQPLLDKAYTWSIPLFILSSALIFFGIWFGLSRREKK